MYAKFCLSHRVERSFSVSASRKRMIRGRSVIALYGSEVNRGKSNAPCDHRLIIVVSVRKLFVSLRDGMVVYIQRHHAMKRAANVTTFPALFLFSTLEQSIREEICQVVECRHLLQVPKRHIGILI